MFWRNRRLSAVGILSIICPACTSFSAASYSPRAAITFARRSLSDSACLAIARFIVSGRITSRTSTETTLIPHGSVRSEEHTSELQSRGHLVCRLLLEKKKDKL